MEQEYTPVSLLKTNARGSIHLVRHNRTGRQLVLRHFTGSSEVYRKLLGYSCQNLPQILEAASQGEKTLVLEEFISGDTLDFLLRDTLFTAEEARKTTLQLCQALWVLHSIGAVHRDIKPSNVILRGADAVLIDFDAARLHKPERQSDTLVLGTTGFAAPEQYGLSQSGPQADIYSLGILLNIMLTGQHPSRQLAKGRLGRVVERCTRVNPEKRYQTVLQLMEAI